MSAEILKYVPESGLYSEKHFGEDFSAPLWVKFTDNEFNEWVGCFGRRDFSAADNVLASNDNTTAFVVAKGKAYLVNISTKEVLYELDEYPRIESIIHTTNPEHFVASVQNGLYLFSTKELIRFCEPHFYTDGIYITQQIGRTITGHLYSYELSQDYNVGFVFDLITNEIHVDADKLFQFVGPYKYEEVQKTEGGLLARIINSIKKL